MSDPSSSYANITPPEEVDSLPSSDAGSDTSVSPSEEEAYSDAEREWRESLQQLELLLTLVLIPYMGKYFGRKCAYWGMLNVNVELLAQALIVDVGWGKFMEWKYPVSVEITSSRAFKAAGMVEAAASL
jgi:hypothetical protein